MRISDWSSDVCSSDLVRGHPLAQLPEAAEADQVERRLQRPGQVEGRVEVGVDEVVPLEQVQLAQPVGEAAELPGRLGSDHLPDLPGDLKSVVYGKSVSGRVDIGGRSIIKQKN